MTMMLGSVPQQDVFQRVTSARSARVAIGASVLGGLLYFCFTFVPLFFGAYWSRATTQGALAALIGGVLSWLVVELLIGEKSLVPPQLFGLGVSVIGMVAGSLLPQWIGRPTPQEDLHAALHHRAAAETHHVPDQPHHH
jgi:Na+/proline symporter